MDKNVHKLIIIGSGPAGLTAAIYASRAELQPVLLAGKTPGGQLMTTSEVENFPGFPEGITGPDLMQNMIKQAERFGTKMMYEHVVETDFTKKPLMVKTENNEYYAQSVIIATGADARWLGLESETRLRGKGVSACATCDGAFFKNKKVFVVGAGDSAMEEALFLTKFASTVTVLVRKGQDDMRASKIMQQRALSHEKISFMYYTEVAEVLGENVISGLKLRNTETGAEEEVTAEGLFVAIGHQPNTAIFKDFLPVNEQGYIVSQSAHSSHTQIDGVFIAGDVFDFRYRQAITAAGSGCMAALDAERYLAELEHHE